MTSRDDMQKTVQRFADGRGTIESVMKAIDDYTDTSRKRTTAQEVAQTIQVLGVFTLLGWVAWLFIAGW